MLVAIVSPGRIPVSRYGGTERIVWWLGRHLVRRGHRVVFLAPRGSSCDFAPLIVYRRPRDAARLIPAGVDIVHDHGVGVAAGRVAAPLIVTLHGNAPPGAVLQPNTVFVSRNQAERHGGSTFVHNGIDPDDYGPPDWTVPRDHLLFLALAAWKVKNVRGAIGIARRAGRRLAVVGGHRFNFQMGVRLTFDTNVRFYGVASGARKHSIINRSSALLFPVRWHEPFGIALLEALYFGCPVFGTAYGSLPEIVTPEVGFLSNREAELVARLADVDRYDRRRCHEYVADCYSADLMTRRYLELYQKVLDGEEAALHAAPPRKPDVPDPDLLPFDTRQDGIPGCDHSS